MRLGRSLFIGMAAVALTSVAVPAHATPFITAYGWITTEGIASSPTGASPASLALATCSHGTATCTTGNADVTFTTDGVNFSASGATIAAWLASSAFTLTGLVDNAPAGTLMDPTIWEFVGNGSFTSPDPFTIAHDDGTTFIVNGQTVINQPGPTSPVLTSGSYTGAAGGNLPFELIYAECCGGPAVLQVSLLGPQSAPVPEPASFVLLGTGLLALARRRFARRS